MEEAEQLCDRVAIMDHGRILESGTVSEVVSSHFKDRTIRFGTRAELDDARLAGLRAVTRVAREGDETVLYTTDVPATIVALEQLAEPVTQGSLDVSVKRPTLEDVFLELTGRALRD
jgi:ABC-2 type transport system ATP-binding protein